LVLNGRGLAWLALWVVPIALASQSCGFPSPEACALECGVQNACPGGFECQLASHRCVPPGVQEICLGTLVGAAEPANGPALGDTGSNDDEQPDAATGASIAPGSAGGTTLPPGSETGGTAGASGAGPSAGGAGGSPPAVNELVIIPATEPASACSDVALARPLQASGGRAPYAWRILQAPPGLQLSGASGAEVTLEGVPVEPGTVIVELQDSAGATARSEALSVHESPRVTSAQLPSVCAGQPYSAVLLASGGNADEYGWSAEIVPAVGLPRSLAELGLSLQGATLSAAESAAIEESAPFAVALRVRDALCSSSERVLEVEVVPGDAEACPRIRIVDPPALDELPAACRGNAYAEALTVDGGEPPFLWSALAVPPGLHFDAESATLSGVSEGDGVLAVEVTDGNARSVEKRYEVRARDACWLAYVASEPSPARLELVDARLLERQPTNARRELPEQVGPEGVFDFQFSPDGRFIAYRLGLDASSARLELAELAGGEVHAIELGGAVGAYAWSPDAAALAVAFTRARQPRLGGLLVEGVQPLGSVPLAGLPSELVWTDGTRLATLTPDPELPELRWLVTTEREEASFAPPLAHTEVSFSARAQLIAGAGGVFAAEPAAERLEFFASGGEPVVSHAAEALVSPSGAFAGLSRAGALQLYRGLDPSTAAQTPFLQAPGCSSLLAWASGRDRIACTAEQNGAAALALFDVRAPVPSLLEPLGRAVLPAAIVASGRRRALSASGRWLALASDEQLYIVRSDGQGARLWASLPSSELGTRPGALVFSPDESWLLIGAGNSLAVLDLQQPAASVHPLSTSALVDDTCSERLLEGRGQWCGRDSDPGLAWSGASDQLAFRSVLGTLELLDLSRLRDGEVAASLAPDSACSEACRSGESFRFQP
jgi:hypothetical protein